MNDLTDVRDSSSANLIAVCGRFKGSAPASMAALLLNSARQAGLTFLVVGVNLAKWACDLLHVTLVSEIKHFAMNEQLAKQGLCSLSWHCVKVPQSKYIFIAACTCRSHALRWIEDATAYLKPSMMSSYLLWLEAQACFPCQVKIWLAGRTAHLVERLRQLILALLAIMAAVKLYPPRKIMKML